MNDDQLLHSAEDFLRTLKLSPPHPESFDTIVNRMDTIKEYREYAHRDSDSWEKYILDIFQILGFHTKSEAQRVLSLSRMGAAKVRCAIAVPIRLEESFKEIIPGLEWKTFLFYAMHFYQVDWGLITDGQKIKIYNFQNEKSGLEVDLETILTEGNLDTFLNFSDVISLIRGGPLKVVAGTKVKPTKKHSKKVDLSDYLTNKSNTVITLLEALRPKIRALSNRIDERFNKMYIGYYAPDSFCQIRPQKDQLKIWINLDIHQASDPFGLCRDVRNVGHHGTGKTEIILGSFNDLDAVFDLIRQAYNKKNDPAQKIYKTPDVQSRHKLRNLFWTMLLEKANQKTSLHANISPGQENWVGTGSGTGGITYNYVIRKYDAHVELYIGSSDKMLNKRRFNYLHSQKDEIERSFGAPLEWQYLEDKAASRVRYVIQDGGLLDPYDWPALQDSMIDSMIRLHAAFQPEIKGIDKTIELAEMFKTLFVTSNDEAQKPVLEEKTKPTLEQIFQKPSQVETLVDKDIPRALLNVLLVYGEMVVHQKNFTEANKEVSRQRGLDSRATTTIDSCTRALGLTVREFKDLVQVPDQLAALLINRYPKYEQQILETISTKK